MPRVLYVVNVGWFFLSHRLALARAARAAGYDVHVACAIESREEGERIAAESFVFHRLDVERANRSPVQAVRAVGRIRRLVGELDPDVVHAVALKTILLAGWATPRRPGRRLVAAFSGLGHVFTDQRVRTRLLRAAISPLYRGALRGPDCVALFQNADDRAAFTGRRLVPSERTTLIRGVGVDLDLYRPSGLPAGRPRVVLPARMLREKGVLEFAAAARLLRAEGVDADFVLAGVPDPMNPSSLGVDEIRALERDCGVRWLGHVHDMRAEYAAATLVCLPSYREGMPKALAEAAAAGRPIVCTDVPGCREAVLPGVNGVLVPAREAEPLAAALGALLRDHDALERMARASRALAEERFDERRAIRDTLALYHPGA